MEEQLNFEMSNENDSDEEDNTFEKMLASVFMNSSSETLAESEASGEASSEPSYGVPSYESFTSAAPYSSFIHKENSINVFPKIEPNAEIKLEPEFQMPSETSVGFIEPKEEDLDSSGYDADTVLSSSCESMVPAALGLLPTSSLKEPSIKKRKTLKTASQYLTQPESTYGSFANQRKRKNIFAAARLERLKKPNSPNMKAALRIYGFLKCIGPHKWVSAEWFKSFMDMPFLSEDTDFQYRLDQIVPPMFKIGFNMFEWSYIRSIMGAVRRLSQEFLQADRYEWERIRVVLRLLQTRSIGYVKNIEIMNGIPQKIPRTLPIGSEVQAIVRGPFRGVHTGSIISFEEPVWAYTVRFPAFEEMGCCLIPDVQLMALRNQGTLTIQPLKTNSEYQQNYQFKIGDGDCMNGYSSKVLISLEEMKRYHVLHKEQLDKLSALSSKADAHTLKYSNYIDKSFNGEFLRKIVCNLLTIEKIDATLMRHMVEVEKFRDELHLLLMPMLSECSGEELVDVCRLTCHGYMLDTYQKPIIGSMWDKICKLLMIFKFVQTVGVNARGLHVLKLHLHGLFFASEGESANVFGTILVPLLEKFVQEIEHLKELQAKKYAAAARAIKKQLK